MGLRFDMEEEAIIFGEELVVTIVGVMEVHLHVERPYPCLLKHIARTMCFLLGMRMATYISGVHLLEGSKVAELFVVLSLVWKSDRLLPRFKCLLGNSY